MRNFRLSKISSNLRDAGICQITFRSLIYKFKSGRLTLLFPLSLNMPFNTSSKLSFILTTTLAAKSI